MDVSARINSMATTLKGLSGLFDGWIREACEAHKEELVQMNRDRLSKGLSHEGYDIFPSYSPSTIRYKIRRAAPFDRVTLKDYGDFHRTLEVVFTAHELHVVSGDPDFDKVAWLQMYYGNQIYGFTESEVEEISVVFVGDEVARKVHEWFKQ